MCLNKRSLPFLSMAWALALGYALGRVSVSASLARPSMLYVQQVLVFVGSAKGGKLYVTGVNKGIRTTVLFCFLVKSWWRLAYSLNAKTTRGGGGHGRM